MGYIEKGKVLPLYEYCGKIFIIKEITPVSNIDEYKKIENGDLIILIIMCTNGGNHGKNF